MLSGRWPLLGHVIPFLRDRDALFRRGYREHGKVFGLDLAGRRMAVVSGAEHNRTFYMATDKSLNIGKVYKSIAAAIGEIMFLANPQTYLNQRPLLRVFFALDRMPKYVDAMSVEAQRWAASLQSDTEVDVVAAMLLLTQAVAGHAFVGPDFRAELSDEFWRDYASLGNSIDMFLPPNLPLPKFIRRDRATRRIRKVISEVIARRRAHPDQYNDMITQVLATPQADGTVMPDDTIASMLIGLFFAAHESTAGQAAWTIISILQHPEVLERVQHEVDAHVGDDLRLDGAVLRRLAFAYMTIDEVSRLYPSADMQARVVEQDVEFGQYRVPAGWQVSVNAAVSHQLEPEFSDPTRFDPARFERGEGSSAWNYVGFGGGPHKCAGMNFARNEIAVIVAVFFKQFTAELVTRDTKVCKGMGASRPSATLIRVKKRKRSALDQ
jgi:sterol 14-demethylase